MAEQSSMLPLGTLLPEFSLVDAVSGKPVASRDVAGDRGVLVIFACNHCPYVVHVRPVLAPIANDALARGIGVVAINSNDVRAYPDDAPPKMKELAESDGWRFPFLYDETQDVARAFHAVCTPEVYLFDAARKLAYRGRIDESTPRNGKPVTGADLRAAIDAVVAGTAPAVEQSPSIGCSIKWR